MKKSLKRGLMAALAVTVVACASTSGSLSTLRDTSVDAPDVAPEEKVYAGKQPGKFALIERTFVGQPPLIPHTVENFDITPKENACLDCFAVCPVHHVIKLPLKGEQKGAGSMIVSGDCSNCGRCIDVCSKDVFTFTTRLTGAAATPVTATKLP